MDQPTRTPESIRNDEVRERPREDGEHYDEPWAKLRIEEEGRVIAKYEDPNTATVSKDTLEYGKRAMIQRADQDTISFAREWLEGNREELGQQGYYIPENPDDAFAVTLAKEAGGFDALKTDERYADRNQRIENAYALRTELEGGAKTRESKMLLINILGRTRLAKQEELTKVEEDISTVSGRQRSKEKSAELQRLKSAKLVLEAEIKELESRMREIYQILAGATPEENATRNHNLERRSREKVIADTKNEVKDKQKKDGKDLTAWGLMASRVGYQVVQEKEGRFNKSYVVIDQGGRIIRRFDWKTIGTIEGFLHKMEVANNITRVAKAWDSSEKAKKRFAQDELNNLALAPEGAIGGIEVVYDRVRDRLITEHIREVMKRDPRSREQLMAIKQEFQGAGLNAGEFIESVVTRKDDLASLSGRWENDQAVVRQFAESWGVPVGSREWEDFAKKQKGAYERRVKTRRGFVDWMIDMVLTTSDKKQINTGRRPGGQSGNRSTATGGSRTAGARNSGTTIRRPLGGTS